MSSSLLPSSSTRVGWICSRCLAVHGRTGRSLESHTPRCILPSHGFRCPSTSSIIADTADTWRQGHLIGLKEAAKQKFYNDLSESEAQKLFESLLPHSQDAFETPSYFTPADITISKTYVICEKDQILSLELQNQLVAQTPGLRAEPIDAGHCPFLSKPDEFAELVNRILATE